jgi:hypothetical protein
MTMSLMTTTGTSKNLRTAYIHVLAMRLPRFWLDDASGSRFTGVVLKGRLSSSLPE